MSIVPVLVILLNAAPGKSDGAIRYLALGDSFTAGTSVSPADSYPSKLTELLKADGKKVELTNMGVNGYTTADVVNRELSAVKDFKPTLVTLGIGANDLVRGRTADEYRATLKLIFKAISAAGISGNALLVIPQPDWVSSPQGQTFGDSNVLRAKVVQFNSILAEETKLANGRYVDLWKLNLEFASKKWFAGDGLHPNEKVYAAWAAQLADVIRKGK